MRNSNHSGNQTKSREGSWPMRLLSRLFGDERGVTFTYVAISLPVIIGFAGVGVDISMWQLEQRKTSVMADAGAIAAGGSVLRTGDFLNLEVGARIGARANGFVGETDVLRVDYPPATGPLSAAEYGDPDGDGFAGHPNAIEVRIRRPVDSYFSSLISSQQRFVSARAVVVAFNSPGGNCFMALDPSSGISVAGTADVNLQCGALANGTIDVDGSACLTAPNVNYGVGDDSNTNCPTTTPPTASFRMPDPLADLPEVDDRDCDRNAPTNVNNNQTRTIGTDASGIFVFCADVTVNPGGTLNLEPGIYVFAQGTKLDVGGILNGDGVMLYFTEDAAAANPNPLQFDAQAEINISAMQPGDLDAAGACGSATGCGLDVANVDGGVPANSLDEIFADIAIFQDRQARENNGGDSVEFYNFTGGGDMVIDGIVYLPGGSVNWSGGTATAANAVVSDGINLTGNSSFGTIEGTNLATLLAIVAIRLAE